LGLPAAERQVLARVQVQEQEQEQERPLVPEPAPQARVQGLQPVSEPDRDRMPR